MPIQAPEEVFFPIEIEAVGGELRRAETEVHLFFIQNATAIQKAHPAEIQVGVLRPPGAGVDALGRDVVFPAAGVPQLLAGRREDGNIDIAGEAVGLHLDFRPVNGGGGDENILDAAASLFNQPCLPVESAVGKIVDHKAKGWNFRVLGGVQSDCQGILPGLHQAGDLQTEGGIAAAVLPCRHAVDKDGGNVGRAVELQEEPLAGNILGQGELSAIAADHLIILVVNIMQRQLHRVVGQVNTLPCPLVIHKFLAPLAGKFPTVANAGFHTDSPSLTRKLVFQVVFIHYTIGAGKCKVVIFH